MWQLWMITLLATLQKYIIFKNLIILGKIKTCNFIKFGHNLCNENKIVKDLVNAFLN
jgi:hypothetical protein